MAKNKSKTNRKPTNEPESAGPSARQQQDSRSAAEVRTESFRIAAQRETVEAFVVAFILALLFRAFLAEAFVIPTGSMAPALMGAHKDLICDQCGTSFQCGASRERSTPDMMTTVVAGVCPNCRHVNALDLQNNKHHQTFNGDRIVVSKYSYIFRDPERWDVIVFKYPGNPKQNYIKRCVGLPNETLTLKYGDVYVRPTGGDGPDRIVRKPPDKLLAMSHLVYDTDHQASALIAAGYPARWQPWRQGATDPPQDSWDVQRTAEGMTAVLDATADDRLHWLRYFHRWPTDAQWDAADRGETIAGVDPFSSRLITDFYAYDSYVNVPSSLVYERPPTQRGRPGEGRLSRMFRGFGGGYSGGDFRAGYQPDQGPEQFGRNSHWGGQDRYGEQLGRDGMHWVGDLLLEAEIATEQSRELILELVEAGVQFRCSVDLGTGVATLSIDDHGTAVPFGEGDGDQVPNPTAQTTVLAGRSHSLRFSNCDDQLLLWVGDRPVEFDQPTSFDTRRFRKDANNHPQTSSQHPLDAAPAAIAIRGGRATVSRLRIDRDKYYVATDNANSGIIDYDLSRIGSQLGRRVFDS